jgi:hypothetical protein
MLLEVRQRKRGGRGYNRFALYFVRYFRQDIGNYRRLYGKNHDVGRFRSRAVFAALTQGYFRAAFLKACIERATHVPCSYN